MNNNQYCNNYDDFNILVYDTDIKYYNSIIKLFENMSEICTFNVFNFENLQHILKHTTVNLLIFTLYDSNIIEAQNLSKIITTNTIKIILNISKKFSGDYKDLLNIKYDNICEKTDNLFVIASQVNKLKDNNFYNSYRSFGESLKIARKSKGISQEEFAGLIGVTVGMISRYENNKAIPNPKIILLMSQLLDVAIEEIMNIQEK